MSDDGVITFDFEEVGIDLAGAEVGMFSGSASIDKDGVVVGLTLDAFVEEPSRQFGPLKQVTRYLKVRSKYVWITHFDDILARKLADTIEKRFERQIADELNDWCVSLAEQEWEYPEAAE